MTMDYDIITNECIVSNNDAFRYSRLVLDYHAIADNHIIFNGYALKNTAVPTDTRR
ncbi:hypothetical protein [Pseudomonas triticicola]|uniref:hypothetical protein n=1 Tax=Pseudomonas triticicola TaxID=2842345 RepID=UPI003EC11F55